MVGVRYALPLNQLRITVVKKTDYPDTLEFKPTIVLEADFESIGQEQAKALGGTKNLSATPTEKQIETYFQKCYTMPDAKITGEITDISKTQISDFSNNFSLRVEPQLFADSDITIARDEYAYLTNVTFNAEGKADEFIVGAAKLVGTVSGFSASGIATVVDSAIAGANFAGIEGLADKKAEDLLKTLNSDKSKELTIRTTRETNTSKTCKAFRSDLIEILNLEDYESKMQDKIIEVALLIGFLKSDVFDHAKILAEQIKDVEQEITVINKNLVDADTLDELKKLNAKKAIKQKLKTELSNAALLYTAKVDTAKKKVKALFSFKQDKTKTDIIDVDIEDLMATCSSDTDCDKRTQPFLPDGIDEINPIKTIFEEARIAVTLSLARKNSYSSLHTQPPNPEPKNNRTAGRNRPHAQSTQTSRDDKAYIAYRDAESFNLTFYKGTEEKQKDGEQKGTGKTKIKWTPIKQTTRQLISASSPIGLVPYDASTLGKRDMALTFESGRLATFNYVTTSDAEALTNGLNSAAESYITNIAKAQKARFELSSAGRAEANAQLQFDIDVLDKQRQILENKNTLDLLSTAEAAELANINQKIELLEKQKALIDAQTGLSVAQNNQQNAIDTAGYGSELERLLALQSLQNAQAGTDNAAQQILLLNMMATIQQQLVDDPESEALNNELEKLQIQLALLLKELEVRGVITPNSE